MVPKLSKWWLLVSIRWSVSFPHHCGATRWIIICSKDKQSIFNELAAGLATPPVHHPAWTRSPVGAGINLGHFSRPRDLPGVPWAPLVWFPHRHSVPVGLSFPALSLCTWLRCRACLGGGGGGGGVALSLYFWAWLSHNLEPHGPWWR